MQCVCVLYGSQNGDIIVTSSSLLTEHPLSEERLKNIFENTRHRIGLCLLLEIPDGKRYVAGAVESYSMSGDPMKGRKMIFNLDRNGDTSLADSVMDCPEPPAGIYKGIHVVLQAYRSCLCKPLRSHLYFQAA